MIICSNKVANWVNFFVFVRSVFYARIHPNKGEFFVQQNQCLIIRLFLDCDGLAKSCLYAFNKAWKLKFQGLKTCCNRLYEQLAPVLG